MGDFGEEFLMGRQCSEKFHHKMEMIYTIEKMQAVTQFIKQVDSFPPVLTWEPCKDLPEEEHHESKGRESKKQPLCGRLWDQG